MYRYTTNARNETESELLENCVDRREELEACSSSLVSDGSNVFLYGSRGVGKTLLVRLVRHKIREENRDIFPFLFNTTSLAVYGASSTGTAFPALVLLELLVSAWGELAQRPYSELRTSIDPAGAALKVEAAAHKYLQNLYRQIRSPGQKKTYEKTNRAGVGFGAQVQAGETTRQEFEGLALLPFEFLEYLEELKRVLSAEFGINRLVAICDEANMMPVEWQEELVSRHIDVFSDHGIRFLFVAGVLPNDPVLAIPRNFEMILPLQGLKREDIPDLIGRRFTTKRFRIESAAVDLLHSRTDGNPRQILTIVQNALSKRPRRYRIDMNLIAPVIDEYFAYVARFTHR